MFRLPVPCCKLLYSMTPTPASLLEAVFPGLLEKLSTGLEVLKIPMGGKKTHNFQLLGCDYFL